MSHSLNTRRRKARKKKNETRLEMNKKKKKKMCTSIVELIHYDVSGTPMIGLEKAMHVVLQEVLGFHSIPILVLSISQFVSQFPAMKHINLIKVKTKGGGGEGAEDNKRREKKRRSTSSRPCGSKV